jgi:hypothetical protein
LGNINHIYSVKIFYLIMIRAHANIFANLLLWRITF